MLLCDAPLERRALGGHGPLGIVQLLQRHHHSLLRSRDAALGPRGGIAQDLFGGPGLDCLLLSVERGQHRIFLNRLINTEGQSLDESLLRARDTDQTQAADHQTCALHFGAQGAEKPPGEKAEPKDSEGDRHDLEWPGDQSLRFKRPSLHGFAQTQQ